mmetsp:Transcript_16642/g.30118  ORF Transcript_16642/g.30118 Transcript_16642/m.30118 type:complete len:241 (-) Transcript_16642:1211-1933(-)
MQRRESTRFNCEAAFEIPNVHKMSFWATSVRFGTCGINSQKGTRLQPNLATAKGSRTMFAATPSTKGTTLITGGTTAEATASDGSNTRERNGLKKSPVIPFACTHWRSALPCSRARRTSDSFLSGLIRVPGKLAPAFVEPPSVASRESTIIFGIDLKLSLALLTSDDFRCSVLSLLVPVVGGTDLLVEHSDSISTFLPPVVLGPSASPDVAFTFEGFPTRSGLLPSSASPLTSLSESSLV